MTVDKTSEGPGPDLGALAALEEQPLVSVIIASLNEERFIGGCLESLSRQDYPASALELLVADGGSEDGTRGLVAEAQARSRIPIVLLHNPGRDAPSGFNTGLTRARGAVIIIFSAHAIAEPDFVRANVEALRETNAAAVGGPIITRGEGRLGRAVAAAVSHPFGVGNARFRYSKSAGFVDTIAFAAYRRECFDVVGGFRTDRVLAVDDFFNYEVRKAGGQLFLTPAVRSTYFSRSTPGKLFRQYFGYGRAKGRAMTETPGSILPRHLVPAAAVAVGTLLATGGLFSRRARTLLLLLGTAYGSAALAAAGRSDGQDGERPSRVLTAVMFPVLHAAYGVGTIFGFASAFRRDR